MNFVVDETSTLQPNLRPAAPGLRRAIERIAPGSALQARLRRAPIAT